MKNIFCVHKFSLGGFVRGVFGKGGFCPGGFCPGVYVRGVFVLMPHVICNQPLSLIFIRDVQK